MAEQKQTKAIHPDGSLSCGTPGGARGNMRRILSSCNPAIFARSLRALIGSTMITILALAFAPTLSCQTFPPGTPDPPNALAQPNSGSWDNGEVLSPALIIEQLVVDNLPIETDSKIHLPAGSKHIAIHYTVSRLVEPQNVRFKFRLEGFDDDWFEAGTRRVAYYTAVPPGDYTFHVMAYNDSGDWLEAAAALAFSLKPFFHQTPLFYLICLLALITASAGLYRMRVRQAIAHEQERARHRAHDKLETKIQERTAELVKANDALHAEISERNKAHEERHATALRLNALITNLRSGILFEDASRHVLYCNPGFCAIFGIPAPPQALVGMDCRKAADDLKSLFFEPESFVQRITEITDQRRTVTNEELCLTDGRTIERDYVPILEGENYFGHLWHYLDITEHKQAEAEVRRLNEELEQRVQRRTAELRASEERYRVLYEDNPVMYFTVDAGGTVLSVNRFGAEQLGFAIAELVGKPVFGVFLEEDRPAARQQLTICLRNPRKNYDWELRKVRKNGSVLWVKETARAVQDGEGKPIVLIVCEDITERKQAESALRESEARFRHLADTAPVMIWMAEIDKSYNYFNKIWLEFTGRTLQQELGDGWTENLHPDDLPVYLESFVSAFDARQEFKLEYRLRRFDGEYRWIFDHGIPRFLADGSFAGYIGSCIDVTERKQAEAILQQAHDELERRVAVRTAELQESQELFRQFAENINDIFWIESLATGELLYTNPNFETVWGEARQNLHEQPEVFLNMVHQEDRERLQAYWAQQRKGEISATEYRIVRPDGSIRWIWDRSFPIRSGEGRVYRCAGIAQDITDRKLAQATSEKLHQMNVRAAAIVEAQEKERRRFSRELHDGLGQILTGIKFSFETLEPAIGAANGPSLKTFAEIKTMLDNAISEGKQIVFNLMPRTLDEFGILPALELLSQQVSQHIGIKVELSTCRLKDRLPANIEMGLYRIAQEALNNVVTHSRATTAAVRLVCHSSSINLVVEDNGQGLSAEGNHNSDKKNHGMGILNMRERAEALNGTFNIISKPGHGTRIDVKLPIAVRQSSG